MSVPGALLLVALVAWIGAGVTGALRRAGSGHGSIALASTLAVLCVMPDLLGRPFHDVAWGAGLTAAAVSPGLLGWRHRPPAGPALSREAIAVLVVLVGLLAWTTITTWLWDERSAHFGISSAVARGALPAAHPQHTGVPFNYHVGFNIVCGLVRRLTALPIDRCIDIVTLVSAVSFTWGLHDVGHALAARIGAVVAPPLALLGYGPFGVCLDVVYGVTPSCSTLFPAPWHHPVYVPPPVVSNFFQHPFGLGMAVALAVFLLGARALEDRSRALFVACAALVALLAQAHILMFAAAGLGLTLACAADALRTRDVRVLVERALLLALALAFALSTAGFFLPAEASAGFVWRGHFSAGFGVSGAASVAMNVLLFTPALLGTALALPRVRDGGLPLMLTVGAVAGFVVGNAVSYERSWDIVKFFGVATLFGNLLLVERLGRSLRASAGIVVAATLLACFCGATWLLRFGPLNGVLAQSYTERAPDALATAVGDAWGDIVGTALVLTPHDTLHEAGVFVVGFDWRTGSRGLMLDRPLRDQMRAARMRALASFLPEDIAATHARFVVVSEPLMGALPAEARARAQALDVLGTLEHAGVRYLLLAAPATT